MKACNIRRRPSHTSFPLSLFSSDVDFLSFHLLLFFHFPRALITPAPCFSPVRAALPLCVCVSHPTPSVVLVLCSFITIIVMVQMSRNDRVTASSPFLSVFAIRVFDHLLTPACNCACWWSC